MLNYLKQNLKLILLALFLGNFTAWLFLRGQIVIFWDQYYPINSLDGLEQNFSVWNPSTFTGFSNGSKVNFTPLILLMYLFSFGDLNIALGQQLLYGLSFSVAAFFVPKLIEKIINFTTTEEIKNKFENQIFWISMISAPVYLYNQFSLFSVYRILNTNFLLFAFIPLCLYLSLLIIESGDFFTKSSLKKIFWIVFINSFVLAPTFANLAFALLFYLFFPFFLFIFGFVRIGFKKSIIFAIFLTLICLIFSSWWIYPSIYTSSSALKAAKDSGGGFAAVIVNSKDLTINSAFILKNTGGINSDCTIWPTPCNAVTYNQFAAIGYLNIVIVFVAFYLIFIAKNQTFKKKTIFLSFASIWVIFSVFISSLNDTNPFRPILYFVYKNSDGLATAFRDAPQKIGNFHLLSYMITLILSVLIILVSINKIQNSKFKSIFYYGFIGLFIIINISPSLIFLMSDSLVSEAKVVNGQTVAGGRFKIPEVYYDMKNIMSENKIQNTIELPLQGTVLSYNNTDPISVSPNLTTNAASISTFSYSNSNTLFLELYKSVETFDESNQYDLMINSLKLMGINSMTLPKIENLDLGLIKGKNLKNYNFYKTEFDKRSDLKKVSENERYIIYKIQNPRPQFYTINATNNDNVTYTNANAKDFYIRDIIQDKSIFDSSDYSQFDFKNYGKASKSSDESIKAKFQDDNTAKISLDTKKNDNFAYINFGLGLDYSADYLKDNYLIVREKCPGCNLLMNTTYTDNNTGEKLFQTNSPLNTLSDESGYNPQSEFTNFAFDLYKPGFKAVDFNIHVINDKSSQDQDIKELNIEKFGFLKKDDKYIQKITPSEICQDIDFTKEQRIDSKEVVKYKTIPLVDVDINKNPYLVMKYDGSNDANLDYYYQIKGVDKTGTKKTAYLTPSFEDKDTAEIDLRDTGFVSFELLNWHIVSTPKSSFGQNKSCVKMSIYAEYSLDNYRIIDILVNNFKLVTDPESAQNNNFKINECKYEKYNFSPNFKLDCPAADKDSILVTNIGSNNDWRLKDGSGKSISPEQKPYLNIFNSFKFDNSKSAELYLNYTLYDNFLIIFTINMLGLLISGLYIHIKKSAMKILFTL